MDVQDLLQESSCLIVLGARQPKRRDGPAKITLRIVDDTSIRRSISIAHSPFLSNHHRSNRSAARRFTVMRCKVTGCFVFDVQACARSNGDAKTIGLSLGAGSKGFHLAHIAAPAPSPSSLFGQLSSEDLFLRSTMRSACASCAGIASLGSTEW